MHRYFLRAVLLVLCLLLPMGSFVSAQEAPLPRRILSSLPGLENRPVITAIRLEAGEHIVVDGRLDEASWERATPATDFVQQDPRNGAPASERTEVRILFNQRSLYIGVVCNDSEPDQIRANQMQRDGSLNGDDVFSWVLDPFLNGINGYRFSTNPLGMESDSLLVTGSGGGPGGVGGAWDGIWYQRVRRSESGWVIEVEIPFRTLAFDPDAPAWGINFQRTIRRKNEETFWNGWIRNQSLQRLTNAGLLEGLSSIDQGAGLNAQPYVAGRFQEAPSGTNSARNVVPSTTEGAVGGDLIYSVTPQLKASLTVNTDFAQTEVDQRQVNLTRFSLFFPERRAFFLEGGTFLGFGREPDNLVTPFFSRNIGLNADPVDPARLTPQRINFGAKVTGQAGRYDVGAIHAETGTSGLRSGERFSVFRGRRRFLQQSYVGTIVTRRSDRSGVVDDRWTTGLDFSLASSRFNGNQNVELSGFYVWNTDLTGSSGNAARGLRFDYPNDRWAAGFAAREVQDNWNPAVGFVQRRSVRNYSSEALFAPRPRNSRYVRRVEFAANLDLYTDLQNVVRSRTIDLELMQLDLQTGDSFIVHVLPSFERPERDFQISPGVVLPKDIGYSFTRTTFRVMSANRRRVRVDAVYHVGTFYSGHQKGLNATVRCARHAVCQPTSCISGAASI